MVEEVIQVILTDVIKQMVVQTDVIKQEVIQDDVIQGGYSGGGGGSGDEVCDLLE